jgi:outer membrane protein OmpA-like peptidoglycan-associated protein
MRRNLLLVLVMLMLPVALMAQDFPKAELFGGFSYQRTTDGINMNGWNASIAGNVNSWFGLVADFDGYYKTAIPAKGNVGSTQYREHAFLFGPQFSYRKDPRITPFFHTLFGGAHTSGRVSPMTAFTMALGGGVDLNASQHFAIRLIQADYYMTRWGGQTQNNLRLSVGAVYRFGGARRVAAPAVVAHPTATCAVESSPIMEGKTTNVTASIADIDLSTAAFTWSTTGGKINGSGSTVVFDSAGAGPGTYTVTARISDKKCGIVTCSANVVVEALPLKPNSNPTVTCSVDRVSLMEGESTRVHATASDPDGDPLTYEWTTSAGSLTGTGANVTFNSAGVPAGTTVTVGVIVSDGRGGTANCSSTIQINALPPKPQPQSISCLSAGFPHNLARINNVDKACLDDVSLKMQNDPRSTLIITGYSDASEGAAKALAKKRAESAKEYLVKGQKLDPGRISVQSAAPLEGKGDDEQKSNRRVEIVFYPEGTQPK